MTYTANQVLKTVIQLQKSASALEKARDFLHPIAGLKESVRFRQIFADFDTLIKTQEEYHDALVSFIPRANQMLCNEDMEHNKPRFFHSSATDTQCEKPQMNQTRQHQMETKSPPQHAGEIHTQTHQKSQEHQDLLNHLQKISTSLLSLEDLLKNNMLDNCTQKHQKGK